MLLLNSSSCCDRTQTLWKWLPTGELHRPPVPVGLKTCTVAFLNPWLCKGFHSCLVPVGTCALPPIACPADWRAIYFSSMWEAHASLPSATIPFLLLLKQHEAENPLSKFISQIIRLLLYHSCCVWQTPILSLLHFWIHSFVSVLALMSGLPSFHKNRQEVGVWRGI